MKANTVLQKQGGLHAAAVGADAQPDAPSTHHFPLPYIYGSVLSPSPRWIPPYSVGQRGHVRAGTTCMDIFPIDVLTHVLPATPLIW